MVIVDPVPTLGELHNPDLHLAGDVHPPLVQRVYVVGEVGCRPNRADGADGHPLGLFLLAESRREERADHRDADQCCEQPGQSPEETREKRTATFAGSRPGRPLARHGPRAGYGVILSGAGGAEGSTYLMNAKSFLTWHWLQALMACGTSAEYCAQFFALAAASSLSI